MDVSKYIGIPFKKGGYTFEGADCKGLVYLFYLNEFGIELSHWKCDYSSSSMEGLRQIAASVPEYAKGFYEVETPRLGDVILLEHKSLPVHVGVVVSKGHMIHAELNYMSVYTPYNTLTWKNKVHGFYRHETLSIG